MVHRVTIFHNQLRNWDKCKALFFQSLYHCVECLCSVFCSVVAEDDGTVAEVFVFCDFPDNGGSIVVFPVERVNIRYS